VSKIMADAFDRNLLFGPFELSGRGRTLRREGVMLPPRDRALNILIYPADLLGELIARQELIDHVWPDVTVEEGSIRVHVAAIRKALGDSQFGNRYIANVKGRGYSFVGTVASLTGGTESRSAEFSVPKQALAFEHGWSTEATTQPSFALSREHCPAAELLS
jgi:DNA-binding winged helix-turn-helix (wHTH) protein